MPKNADKILIPKISCAQLNRRQIGLTFTPLFATARGVASADDIFISYDAGKSCQEGCHEFAQVAPNTCRNLALKRRVLFLIIDCNPSATKSVANEFPIVNTRQETQSYDVVKSPSISKR